MKRILVTGSCGFIFSNFMRKVAREKSPYTFISVDKVLAEYNQYNVALNRAEHTFYMGDIADEVFMNNVFMLERPDIVIHTAAESFVDDSIRSAGPFIHSNVVGTQVLVDMAIKHSVERFVYVSTDEVYGQLGVNDPAWTEGSPISPRNPYSASKAAGELLVRAAGETHQLPYLITRCCNNYGPSQPPRNLVPKVISSLMRGKKIPIHGNGQNMREWIYADDHCAAVELLVEKGTLKEAYNIGTGVELKNLEMVEKIAAILGKKPDIEFIRDRPGHDLRYLLDFTKISKLGWKPQHSFDEGLKKCVQWYVENDWFLASNGV